MIQYSLLDSLRRAQGEVLERLGLGPTESEYRILASGRFWRLRGYDGSASGPDVLIVSAPIKRPYIWDLAPGVSAVRYCRNHRVRPYLLEWLPPTDASDNLGLEAYADGIGDALAVVSRHAGRPQPILMGHSLGGTLAAIFAALKPSGLRGLVLLGAPLSFHEGVSRFRDVLVSMVPATLSQIDIIPGSLLSELSALASPQTFVWSRMIDGVLSLADPQAANIHARVERWALDEVSLPGKLVGQILQWLYRENRFCRGSLTIGNRRIGPASLRVPVLAAVNTADEIAPPQSITPFLEAMKQQNPRLIRYPGEVGVGLQHLAILVGRQAHAQVWPEVLTWVRARASQPDNLPGKRPVQTAKGSRFR